MRTVGIIVEYNPLHNGHVHHFEQSKRAAEADACIAVMSGHFLQRGEPAVVNKWARAEMALRMGADLVIELPVAYSCQPAEWFAYGAVKLLHATGVTDALCFGSEDGRMDSLEQLADRLCGEDELFRSKLLEHLKQGISYPAAYSMAAVSGHGQQESPALDQPNNILGLHYLMALRRLNSPILPLTIARQKAGYHQAIPTDATIASATAIRNILFGMDGTDKTGGEDRLTLIKPFVPAYTLEILQRELAAGRGLQQWEAYATPLFSQLLGRSAEELGQISEVTEGLENRIKHALKEMTPASDSRVEALLTLLKTKRYTRTKLQRMLLRILLQHPKQELSRERLTAGPDYIRVLGFGGKGRQLLKTMKQRASLPVIIQARADNGKLLDLDIRATSVYSQAYREQGSRQWLQDFYQPPVQAEPEQG